ncbi:thiol reductant ABC exporter subunit CydC [Saccharothrix violaceirubra]|uniref:ATP-binding cassette subfamily C protein CydC n=1 Tax=Saccharothrix violaceirubra TaxID=413306 RepID=A0A7W7T9E8_9PSEU|nr:ATP-binding cassette subfamily C protein CydC [Saccharothrix violaceirubra]
MKRLVTAVLAGVAAELAGIGLTVTAVWLILHAAQQPPLASLTVAIIAVRTLAIARGTLRYAERLAGHDAVLRFLVEARGRVYDALVRRPVPGGDALTRLVSDVDALQDVVLRCLLPAAVAAAVGLAALIATGFALPLVIGLAGCGALLPFAAYRWSTTRLRDLAPVRADLAQRTVTLLDGAAELTAFAALDRELDATGEVVDTLARKEKLGSLGTAALGGLAVVVQFGTAVFLLWQGEPGHVVLGAVAVLEMTIPLTAAAHRFAEVRGSLDRLRETLAAQAETPVTVPLPPGRRTAIVGRSGAGKTTLLDAIAAAHPGVAKGALADSHVFHATVRANVVFAAPDATDADLDRVARTVDLDVPWDTVVGEHGTALSGGQRQRLVLARALLADPDVLLLDEPVEGLAVDHGDEVLARVLDAARDRVVLVTHRLAPLVDFDEILVVEDGVVTRRGTHAELLAVPGHYRDRWHTERSGGRSATSTSTGSGTHSPATGTNRVSVSDVVGTPQRRSTVPTT